MRNRSRRSNSAGFKTWTSTKKRIDLHQRGKSREPDFWDNPDKAREQLRKVAGIKAWVEDYDAIRKDAEDLQLMPTS